MHINSGMFEGFEGDFGGRVDQALMDLHIFVGRQPGRRMRMRWLRPLALALAALTWVCTAMAVQLNDLRPEQLKSFVQADRVTVVLFTSPDEKCGFCVGQLNVFNAAAIHYPSEPPAFGFLQWRPWRAFPELDLPRPLLGIPHVMIFRKGELLAQVDGKFTDPAKLTALVDDALAGKLKPLPPLPEPAVAASASAPVSALASALAPVAASAPATKPFSVSDTDRAAVTLHLRRELLTRASDECLKRNPSQAAAAERARTAWNARHGKEAGRGLLVMLEAPTRSAMMDVIDPIGQAQARDLHKQVQMSLDLKVADCERLHRFIEQEAAPPAR